LVLVSEAMKGTCGMFWGSLIFPNYEIVIKPKPGRNLGGLYWRQGSWQSP
jgi:hypothetical protein